MVCLTQNKFPKENARTKPSQLVNQFIILKSEKLRLFMEQIIQDESLGDVIETMKELIARVDERLRRVSEVSSF